MGDMGDDIAKTMAGGCLIALVMIGLAAGGEYYLVTAFLSGRITFDGVLLFVLVSAFFLASMWRLYKMAIDYIT